MPPSKKAPSISLWHPFSAMAIGLEESSIPFIHSKPHISALRHMAGLGWKCRVEYLSQAYFPYRYQQDNISWWFWPVSRSLRSMRRAFRFRSEYSLLALLKLWVDPPDVLVLNMSGHGSRMTRWMGQIMEHKRKPYIAMIGGLHISFQPKQLHYFQNAFCIITHTEGQQVHLQQLSEVVNCRFDTLPLGVDCNYFYPNRQYPQDNIPKLLFVGRWQEWKNIHIMIEELVIIRQHYPSVELHIVGPISDPDYFERVSKRIDELSLAQNIIIHGPKPYDELRIWYQSADLLLLLSRPDTESFGMVVVESMACGTPVIAQRSEMSGPSQIISHGIDGLLVQPSEVGIEIIELLDHPERLAQMREAARHKAVTFYNEDITSRKFESIVSEALGVEP